MVLFSVCLTWKCMTVKNKRNQSKHNKRQVGFKCLFCSLRVFRRRRRPRSSLARLLSNVTESCQSWLDEKVFRGVFGTGQNQSQDQDQHPDMDREYDQDQDWVKSSPTPLVESSWFESSNTELDDSRNFTYGG